MTLDERINAAIRRITSGRGAMRIPAEPTDPDLVLSECQAKICLMENALVALLEFYNPAPWTPERSLTWATLTGSEEATIKVLGDLARKALSYE